MLAERPTLIYPFVVNTPSTDSPAIAEDAEGSGHDANEFVTVDVVRGLNSEVNRPADAPKARVAVSLPRTRPLCKFSDRV